MVKQSYTDKITQRSIHIHTHKQRKRKKKYIYIYEGREQPNQQTNLPMIISSKYETKINIKLEMN